ncbi:helix-turn-helix transcriptional regulator [Novosphingobium kaempferiae]|uniref:helix-turn-helix transcriptional regulator n=1 Tax=Novosphingobium kaempferiae TaxID=2896849 RepID=UPI001E6013D8|nr:LuxR family transcriptional regulator [Novosphingobium kaempferiae]
MMYDKVLASVRCARAVDAANSFEALADAVDAAARHLGFTHFAITHHLDARRCAGRAFRINNYPTTWVRYYDRHQLYVSDPVHRLSHLVNEGFTWSSLARRVALSRADRHFMDLAARHGIGDGFTVPVHIPGEAGGSVTFVNPVGRTMCDLTLIMAHAIGETAFAAARRLSTPRGHGPVARGRPLTPCQQEVTYWIALGKTDPEIAMIMGTSQETPGKHVSNAFERYEVNKRALLVLRAVFDGTLILPQILPHLYSPFPE